MKQLRVNFNDKLFHPTFGKDSAVLFFADKNRLSEILVLSKSLVPDKDSFDDAYYFRSHFLLSNPLMITSYLRLTETGEFKDITEA